MIEQLMPGVQCREIGGFGTVKMQGGLDPREAAAGLCQFLLSHKAIIW